MFFVVFGTENAFLDNPLTNKYRPCLSYNLIVDPKIKEIPLSLGKIAVLSTGYNLDFVDIQLIQHIIKC